MTTMQECVYQTDINSVDELKHWLKQAYLLRKKMRGAKKLTVGYVLGMGSKSLPTSCGVWGAL